MKKTVIIISAICVAVMLCLAGCSALDFVKQIEESVSYPDQYLIEYEITSEDNTIITVARGRDASGNYYYKNGAEQRLFIKDGNKYSVYELTEGEWVKSDTAVNEKYILDNTATFIDYSEKSKEKFNGQYKEGEGKVLLGRECDTYTLTLDIVNFEQEYEMAVCAESGVCMSYWGISTVNSEETGRVGFECTGYATSDLDFSAYLN